MISFLIFGLFTVTGLKWLFGWLWLRPEAGIPFVAAGWWKVKDPTWNVLLKLVYWGIAITLYFWAFEVFLGIFIYHSVRIMFDLKNTYVGAVREKGWAKGILVGTWRAIPIVLEPLFFSDIKAAYTKFVKRNAPEDPSIFRGSHTSNNPPPNPEDTPDPSGGRIKLVKAVEKPDPRKLEEYRNKPLVFPSKETGNYGLKPGVHYITRVSIDDHDAKRAGRHWDIRIQHPTYGIVDSFVSRHSRLPELGKPIQVNKSDVKHGRTRMHNARVIPKGYGEGTSKPIYSGEAIIWIDKESRHLHMMLDTNENFAIVKSGNRFMMVKMADSVKNGKPVPHYERPREYKDMSRKPEAIRELAKQGYVGEVKDDGAFYTLEKTKKGDIYLISRKGMIRDGKPVKHPDGGYQGINRAAQIPGLYEAMENVPKGTRVGVEVVALSKGDHSSAHGRTAAVLNSNVVSSWKDQDKHGRLGLKLLYVDRYAGKDVSRNAYKADRKVREQIRRDSGKFLSLPKTTTTPASTVALYEDQKAQGGEGIVMRHLTDPDAPIVKFKVHETWDYKITAIKPVSPKEGVRDSRTVGGLSKTSKNGSKWLVNGVPQGAGHVEYVTSTGAVGKAGSGLNDDQRKEMWENPEKFLGEGNAEFRDGAYYAIDRDKVPAMVEVKGMSRSETTGIVRAPVVERVRFDK